MMYGELRRPSVRIHWGFVMRGQSANPDSKHTAQRSRAALTWLALILVAACLLAGASAYFFFLWGRSHVTLPRVFIEDPRQGDEVVSGTPSIVFGRADDPDGVAKADLWINGQLIASQANPSGESPFKIVQSWRPTDVGAYLVLLRATDAQGYVGQSATILINVREKTLPAADALSEIPAAEEGGQPSFVPVTEGPPEEGGAPGDGDHPTAGLPDPPSAPPVGASEIEPGRPPFSLSGLLCLLAPSACAEGGVGERPRITPEECLFLFGSAECPGASRPGALSPNPPRVLATYGGACQIDVYWTDESEDETGYKVFRLADGSVGALVALTEGAGIFRDNPRAPGAFRYYVAAYNSQGESPSAPSTEINVPPGDCASDIPGEVTQLDLEALTFQVPEDLNRAYCYYAVAGAPYVRVPGDEAEFMELTGAGWNIADYAGGRRRLRIPLAPGLPLEVAGKCLGWHGAELVDLGEFRQTHGPEDWDGRTLSASSGHFTVEYRIQPAAPEAREGAPMTIIDPSIPAPYNLHFGLFTTCSGGGREPVTCAVEEEGGLQWDWEPPAGIQADWATYKVFLRIPGAYEGGLPAGGFGAMSDAAAVRREYYSTTRQRAPGAYSYSQPCIVDLRHPVGDDATRVLRPEDLIVVERIYYSVQAQVPSPAGGYVESPMSEELEITLSGCPRVLAITVDSLSFNPGEAAEWHSIAGGCDPADVFGTIAIGETRLTWNCPYCESMARYAAPNPPYPASGRPSHHTQLGCSSPGLLRFENVPLDQSSPDRGSSGFSYDNNVVLVPMESERHPLNVRFWFNNYDSGFYGDDNLWCSGGEVYDLDWHLYETLAVRQTRHDNAQSPNCSVVLGIRILETR